MSFYRKIKYFLVHTLKMSNKKAQELIAAGHIEIDGTPVFENCLISENSEIKVNGKTERERKDPVYLLFHKPAGFESTLNETIDKNLSPFFPGINGLAIAGRLDKQSEGLMLLSNDGKWVEQICNPKFEKEKEYLVILDKKPDALFFESFKTGIKIGYNLITKPCVCTSAGGSTINIILTEGKNRQIRRMCKALGYNVIKLQRLRIAHYYLDDLEEGKFKVVII